MARKLVVSNNTIVKKVVVGTPIRNVQGAFIDTLADLTDTDVEGVQSNDLLAYNSSTGKWRPFKLLSGGTF